MHWLFLLLALAAFAIAMTTTSMVLSVACIIAALVLLVVWILGWLSQRIGSHSRDDTMMIDPVELKRLREAAQARRAEPPPAGQQAAASDETPRPLP